VISECHHHFSTSALLPPSHLPLSNHIL
jgi:hypothetical protein